MDKRHGNEKKKKYGLVIAVNFVSRCFAVHDSSNAILFKISSWFSYLSATTNPWLPTTNDY